MSILLQAFEGKNKTVPVWFMRQAGRFLPEYRAIRQSHSLDEMFGNSDIVSEVTCLPVKILNVDAAILFADILTLPSCLGFNVTFDPLKGPVINNPITSKNDLTRLNDFSDCAHIREAIPKINVKLPPHIPLIGFSGGPFTVLSYLIEGGSANNFRKTFRFLKEDPRTFNKFMAFLTKNTIKYLKMQQEAGIKVFQVFDTWAGILKAEDYKTMVLPFVKDIFNEIKLPSIYFTKGSHHLFGLLEKTGSQFISLDETLDFKDSWSLNFTRRGIQGNLHPGFLYSEDKILKDEVVRILKEARKFKKYIFNLSHGIFPDVSVDKVKFVVERVHKFQK